MQTPYSIDEVKDALEERFEDEFFDGYKQPEKSILKWLKNECFNCKSYDFFDTRETTPLYELAKKIEKNDTQYIYSSIFYSPDLNDEDLENFYNDYTDICVNYTEDIIDKESINLSNLGGLMRQLALETISQILVNFKEEVDLFLKRHPEYERTAELLQTLESDNFKELLNFNEVLLDFNEDEDGDKYLFDLKLNQSSKEQLRENLVDYESEEIKDFLESSNKNSNKKRLR